MNDVIFGRIVKLNPRTQRSTRVILSYVEITFKENVLDDLKVKSVENEPVILT